MSRTVKKKNGFNDKPFVLRMTVENMLYVLKSCDLMIDFYASENCPLPDEQKVIQKDKLACGMRPIFKKLPSQYKVDFLLKHVKKQSPMYKRWLSRDESYALLHFTKLLKDDQNTVEEM